MSLAWVDGQSLRTYRHSPNTGSRKSWAAGDATSRAVRLALIAKTGEMGYPSVLTAKTWGFYDVLFKGNEFKFQRPYGSYVMENVLFKISFPAEFHSQTAVEAAMTIHGELAKAGQRRPRTSRRSPSARTRPASASSTRRARSTIRPTATTASSTWWRCRSSSAASPPATTRTAWRRTRASTRCATRSSASRTSSSRSDYHDPEKRSIANALTVEFNDGKKMKEIVVEYPIGHKRRRKEGMPVLVEKFKTNLARRFPEKQRKAILELCLDSKALEATPVNEFVDLMSL